MSCNDIILLRLLSGSLFSYAFHNFITWVSELEILNCQTQEIYLSKPWKHIALLTPELPTCVFRKKLHYNIRLDELYKREVKLANGQVIAVPYVGPIQVQFEDRFCFVGAMVMGDEILLGAIPMEDMDLIVHPKLLKLSVHPERPNLARGLAM